MGLALRNVLVAIGREVVDTIFVCPRKVRREVLYTYVRVGKWSGDALSPRESSWQNPNTWDGRGEKKVKVMISHFVEP